MLKEIKCGDKIKCLNCGESIEISSDTLKFDPHWEYIICPTCDHLSDVQVYHMFGEMADGGEK